MNTNDSRPGRLRGGLSRFADRLRLWHFMRRNGSRIGWALFEGAVGAVVGLVFVAAYLAAR